MFIKHLIFGMGDLFGLTYTLGLMEKRYTHVHQNHSYNFKGFESKNDVLNSNDGLLNQREIGENTLNLLDSNYYFSRSSIKKNNSKEFKNRNLGKLSIIFPELSFLFVIYKKIYRRFILRKNNSHK